MELTLLLKYWQQILLGGTAIALALALVVTRHTLANRTESLHNLTVSAANFQQAVSLATAKAEADDIAHSNAVKEQDEKIRNDNEADLKTKLANADALANAYANRLRSATASANTRGGKGPSLPAAPDPSGPATGPSPDPVVDDTRICAENTVLAQGWQDWFKDAQAVER